MANIVPNSFKANLLKGVFNFDTSGNGGNTFKCALYTAITGYSTSSTVYLSGTSNNEVSIIGVKRRNRVNSRIWASDHIIKHGMPEE